MELIEKPNLATLKLYANQVLELIEEAEGEANDQTEAALTLIQDKLLGGCFALDKRKQSIADKKAMIKELQASVKRDQKSVEFLEGAVLGVMDSLGVQKIESYKRFTAAKKPGRVEIEDPEAVPLNFCNISATMKIEIEDVEKYHSIRAIFNQLEERGIVIKTTSTPNKTAIKEAIKRGEVVTGARLVENEKSLRIK